MSVRTAKQLLSLSRDFQLKLLRDAFKSSPQTATKAAAGTLPCTRSEVSAMTDPSSSGGPLSVISQATELLTAHGVYALTVIFIFYQQRRAYLAMSRSSPKDHAYFRRVYTSVVAATYVLMVLSTGVWFYANFIYSQKAYIKGMLMGLTEHRTPPSNEKDQPEILQEIAPASDVELYVDKKSDAFALDGKYDLNWVLFPKERVTSLVFRFQHHYEVWRAAAPSANPFETDRFPPMKKRTIRGFFALDLGKIHYTPGHSIQLMYEPDSDVKKIGKMYLLLNGERIPLLWQEAISGAQPKSTAAQPASHRLSSFFSGLRVFAADVAGKGFFKENGDYDPETARVLRERLGGTNLAVQIESVDLLADQGARSFKFIADSLNLQEAEHFDEGLLKHNLAAAVDKMESRGIHAPPELSLQLAMMFYTDQNYKSAVRFFDRAGDKPIHDDEYFFFRGYAHLQAEQYQQSALDYQQYLTRTHKPQYDAVACDSLGTVLMRLGRVREAIEQYKKAMRLNPKYSNPYNNLAYLYADRGENLTAALDLVNTALRLDINRMNVAQDKDTKQIIEHNLAEAKDTKGWILFKSGNLTEALPLIREAAKKLPDDPDVRKHLSAIQGAFPKKAI